MDYDTLYPQIFRRKSFHLFAGAKAGHVTDEELARVRRHFVSATPLLADIRVEMRTVPEAETSCRRGGEYCLLFYSQNAPGYLQNVGYLCEQLDLWLASQGIGALWYGMGKTSAPPPEGMEFVIMMAIAKVRDGAFRKDMFKAKRKEETETWHGAKMAGVSDIARFAPSACNKQPWVMEREAETLHVCRYVKSGKHGIMPKERIPFNSRIDAGILLCFLELCLHHEGIAFARGPVLDAGDEEDTLLPSATYQMTFPS